MPSHVRPARPDDLDACLDLARAMHAEAPAYRQRPLDADKVARFLGRLCEGTAPDMVLFVAEDRGTVVGGIIGCLTPEWYSDELLVAEIALFVAPTHRRGFAALRLVRALVEWGRLGGASHARAGATTGVDTPGTARLYRFAGFHDAGPVFAREVPHGDGRR